MTSAVVKDDVVNNNSTENVLDYAVSLFDVDDYFVQSELKNFQNDNSIIDGPANCVNNLELCSEVSAAYSILDAEPNEVKLPDDEVIYIISKNAHVYKCDACDIHYSNTFDLVKHQRVHTKTFNCHLCDGRFSNTFGLSRHMLRSHRKEKRHQCLECGKAFHQIGHLTAHMRVHTGEKPYVCTVCQKTFAHYANLITHRKIHSQERPYECEICTKRFVRASNLIEHRKIHGGNKPYSCDMCENKYKRNSHLVEHKRSHTGERPYKCNVCEEKFTRCSGLNKHRKKHHK